MGLKQHWKQATGAAMAIVLVVTWAAVAQSPPPPPQGDVAPPPDREGPRRPGPRGAGGPGDERNREIFEQVMVARLSSELKLSDEQTVLMVRRYFDFKEENRKLRRERAELLRQLRALVKDDAAEGAMIDAKLGELVAADEKLAVAKRRLYERLSEGLDAPTRAKLYVFLQELEGELKKLGDEVRMRRPGPDGPPPGEMRRGENGPRRMEEGRLPGGRRGPGPEGPPPNVTPTESLPAPPPPR